MVVGGVHSAADRTARLALAIVCVLLSAKVLASSAQAAESISLNGDWKIATDPDNTGKQNRWFASGPVADARGCRVPGVLETTFPAYDGVVWYWKTFGSPRIAGDERLLLKFHAADYLAEVWVNGKFAGSHEGGETPFEFDVTKLVRSADNKLAVRIVNPGGSRVDGMTLYETPHGIKNAPMKVGNFWNPGGLWQPVELLRVPAVRIERVFVTATRTSRSVHANISISNDTGKPATAQVSLAVSAATGGPVIARERRELVIPEKGGSFAFEQVLTSMHEWTPADPFLYRVAINVQTGGMQDTQNVPTGFRELVFRDGYFRLNDKRIFLRGTHSVGHFPIGQHVPHDPELLRRELIYVKAMGFNMVRWLGRTMFPQQLDLCDELGLMVYEESYGSWGWRDPPQAEMARRFDSGVREMILRDRNHPSLVIWGLLNETVANSVYRHAVQMLPLVRSVDSSRMVFLSSGRWDGEWSVGSISNPGSSEWAPSLGGEAAGAASVPQEHPAGYTQNAGDAHMYVPRPWRPEDLRFFRTVGSGTRNVFLSEYGNGSQIDPIRIIRLMEQNGGSKNLDDYKLYFAMYEQLERDWKRWELDRAFASPSDMILAGQRMQSTLRLSALDAIRSNPHLAGYSLTGLSDQAIEGEGLMTTFRELKPGIVDAMTKGFAPLRWCLFTGAQHVYRGATVHVEAVLANEDVLRPGKYPVRLKVVGPAGTLFEKAKLVEIPDPQGSPEPPMAFNVFNEDVKIDGPEGAYNVEVFFDHGAADVGRQTIIAGDPLKLPALTSAARVIGSAALNEFLRQHGVRIGGNGGREVIIVGPGATDVPDLLGRVRSGSVAVVLEPSTLPKNIPGKLENSAPLYWGRDDVVKPHPIFAGLPARQLMDLNFYGSVIARTSITDFQEDAENLVPAFAVGRPGGPGYWAGSNLLAVKHGKGKLIFSTLRLTENLGKHPAADRILLNLVSFAAESLNESKRALRIPMRDGVQLAADFYPAAGMARAPVLLMRTPYNRLGAASTAKRYAEAGYNVLVQDTRGRFESGGNFYPYYDEGQDGYDTLDWIRRQPWSDGRVGMWGASYVGAVQWQAIAEQAPGLAAVAPTATWSSFYRNVYLGGTVRLGLVAQAAAALEPRPAQLPERPIDWPAALLHLPLSDLDKAIGWTMPWLEGILTHPHPDGFWKRLDLTSEVTATQVPSQHIVGYYDFFCREVVDSFQRTRAEVKQLVLGPWDHGTIGKSKVGDVEFGPNARLDLESENLAWFDRVLKNKAGAFPQVRYFSMGENVWRTATQWPPADARSTAFYLHSDGRANTASGTGLLTKEAPNEEKPDVFVSDPANPVPAVAAVNGRKPFEVVWGPVDQSETEKRKDVLVYSTPPLVHSMRFAGPIRSELSVKASTPDSDWVVKLIDVSPDGFAQNLAAGIQRSSFRVQEQESLPAQPGEHYRIDVDLGHVAALVGVGHRLRVEVTGSYFPLFDRNTNTGEGPFSGLTRISNQTLEHSAGSSSRIFIPLTEGTP